MIPELTNPKIRHTDRFFINGEWVLPQGGITRDVISPDDGRIVARVAQGSRIDGEHAIAAARKAFDEGPWPLMPVAERISILKAMVANLEARVGELAKAWSLQMGGLESMAIPMHAGPTAAFANMLAVGADFPFQEPASTRSAAAAIVVHEPVGVVLAITPWNGPYSLMMAKVGPALVAGCTVVMKPASETPLEAYIVAECAEAAGLPPGVLNLIIADRDVADHMVGNPAVDKVSFTGSTTAGRRIAEQCGSRIARYTLELGGKSAAIVLDDYPVDEAADLLARAITTMSGQICSMLSRVLVPRVMHDQLAEAIARRMEAVVVGRSDDPAAQMGPLASRRQLERVEDYIRKGLAEGATLITGGKRPEQLGDGCFLQPTLFADVDNNMAIAQEEIFGPVLCLIPYDDVDEAVRLANASIYGLGGAVLTRDAGLAYRIARRVRTGKLAQNGMKGDPTLPSGGFKQSGVGREGGAEGLRGYLETKTIFLDALPDTVA